MPTGSDVRLAQALLQALEESSGGGSASLTAKERSQLLTAVLRATAKDTAAAAGSDEAVDVETARPDAVQRAVEASFLCLRERLGSEGGVQEELVEQVRCMCGGSTVGFYSRSQKQWR